MALSNVFVHHVFFRMKNPGSAEDRAALAAGLRKLSRLELIRDFHIGVPAGTSRNVVDNSYGISWLVFFATAEDQDKYQAHPIHLEFVSECSRLWETVTVYDVIDAAAASSTNQ